MDEWLGLPRSRPLSLRRSGHDAGFVCVLNPSASLALYVDTFSVGHVSGMVHSLAVISGEAHWDLVPSKLERLESLTQIGLPRRTLVFKVGFFYVQGRFLLTDFYPWELTGMSLGVYAATGVGMLLLGLGKGGCVL